MKQADILAAAPKVLTQDQRAFYFETGYLMLPSFVSDEWLARLAAVTDRFIEQSCGLSASDSIIDNVPLSNTIVRGEPARWIEFDPRPCLIPPDWSKGYTSIFAPQQEERAGEAAE
ncbi:MAG TPA: hypothetical protein VM325_06740 [Alphaproteobacteria bacterium]|nr:hypothetical protein [Alphaproteobacteria bacterium]